MRRLVEINSIFYETFAEPFAASRATPPPGFIRLLEFIPPNKSLDILDIGCGDGRFGRFLIDHGITGGYTGIDFTQAIMEQPETFPGRFVLRDLSMPGCLEGLGRFDLVVCLSTLQHIPGQTTRERFVKDMAATLKPGGRIFLSNWQFLESPRQSRKIRAWSQVEVDPDNLEQGDYLLAWNRGGKGVRYVNMISEKETEALAALAGLRIGTRFWSDGREGDLNLYTILAVDTP